MTIISFSKGNGALSTLTQLQKSEIARTTSISKISSSSKIRKASDAVADSAIGTKLKVEVESLKQLLVGTAQAKAALDIAEGGLNEMTQILTRMNTLAMSAKNGIYKAEDVSKINLEFTNLIDEIDRIAKATNFNSKQLLSGTVNVITDSFENTHLGSDLRDGFLSSKEQGIESIDIDNSKTNTAYILSYDQQTRIFKVTSLNDKNEVDELKVASDNITEGSYEELNFSKAGIKITLNSNFDKEMSIGAEKNSMMDPKYHQDNIKNLELLNYIHDDLIDAVVDLNSDLFSGINGEIGKFKISGEGDEFTLPTKLNEAADSAILADIKAALDIPAFVLVDNESDQDVVAVTGAGSLSTSAIGTINTATSSVEITSVSWDTAFKESGTNITEAGAKANDITFGDFSSFKITAFDSDSGKVTFEAVSTLSIDVGGTGYTTDGTVKGSFQLDPATYQEGIQGIDYATQSIEKDLDGNAKLFNKEGVYTLKDNEVVSKDGFVYNQATGEKVLSMPDDPTSTIQLKVVNQRTNDLDITNITGNLTDISSFDVKIKGTNGKAILYIEAENGALESEEQNLTDINYNNGIDETSGKYTAADDNSSYIAKNKLSRGQVTLKRVIANGQREDSITIDLNKLKTGGLISTNFKTTSGADEDKATVIANDKKAVAANTAGMIPDSLALGDISTGDTTKATFSKSEAFKNDTLFTLNELKNTVVAFQETSDKTNLSFQVGTGAGEENSVNLTIDSVSAFRLQLINNKSNTKIELSDNQEDLQKTIELINTAIDTIQTVRSEVAVGDNRLNVANSSIQTSITNSQAAVSAIFDLDIPSEMVELSQSEMMEQSSIEVLSREMRAKQNLMKLF